MAFSGVDFCFLELKNSIYLIHVARTHLDPASGKVRLANKYACKWKWPGSSDQAALVAMDARRNSGRVAVSVLHAPRGDNSRTGGNGGTRDDSQPGLYQWQSGAGA